MRICSDVNGNGTKLLLERRPVLLSLDQELAFGVAQGGNEAKIRTHAQNFLSCQICSEGHCLAQSMGM